MKKLILISLLALSFTGCLKEQEKEKIVTETVTIKNGCYYYLSEGNCTVYDIYCTEKDLNKNGVVVVSYEIGGFTANILKIEDDIKK